ncbi:MAG: 2-dehydro-3-deoxy-6-phosphogalactonate aldolase [Rhizobiales bacterium PAR1]|nr:MAG: 2-dehydro-3-deoxy-6-phosphogalactonate aldolase [Rhizobiales bacterium PAR1]
MKSDPHVARFETAFAAAPLVAILRGLEPQRAEAIGDILVAAGIRIIEVPLNSPDPFDSIARLVKRFGDRALIGAGTVMEEADIAELKRIGAGLAVSPHADVALIRAARAAGLVSLPGILSSTEAFAAIRAGANGLKLFPMEMIGASGVKAMRAVLPKGLKLIAVGGVGPANMRNLQTAGCDGFGLGSSLFKPGMALEAIRASAEASIAAVATQ